MKNVVVPYLKRILLLALVIVVGLLVFPSFRNASISQAQPKDQAINISVSFTEPTTQLEKLKLDSSSKLDIITNNIHISGVDTWRGDLPQYIIALHYTDFNNDETEHRFVFVVRSSLGDPWIVADMPVKDPNGVSDISRTVWFGFDVDRTILQSTPNISASWFTEVANSTIEVGITDKTEINISGPGDLPMDEKNSLEFIKIEDVLVFTP